MNLEALKALAEAVEAGRVGQFRNLDSEFGHGNGIHAKRAYNGSLDAALALHDAMLPGRKWARIHSGEMLVWNYGVLRSMWGRSNIDPPSRALLLAIIRAKIAQAEKGE
jgi:hypothetical protein